MEVECYIIEHVEWTCIKPKEEFYVRKRINRILIFIVFLLMQKFTCGKRTSKSLLECIDQDYFQYNVTHYSQLWSLAAKSGTVRQEIQYKCDDAYPPLRFIGWDETEFDNLDSELPCNVKYALMLGIIKHFYCRQLLKLVVMSIR